VLQSVIVNRRQSNCGVKVQPRGVAASTTIVLVTHASDVAERADRIIEMCEGSIVGKSEPQTSAPARLVPVSPNLTQRAIGTEFS